MRLAYKGHRIGWWTGERFITASPGRSYQLRAGLFCQARRDLAGLRISDGWTLG